MAFSQDQPTWKHTCIISADGHDESSSFVHIFPLFFIILSQMFLDNVLIFHHSEFPSCLFHIYLIMIIYIVHYAPSYSSCKPLITMPSIFFEMECFIDFYFLIASTWFLFLAVKMSSFPLIYPTLILLFDITNVLT